MVDGRIAALAGYSLAVLIVWAKSVQACSHGGCGDNWLCLRIHVLPSVLCHM